MSNSRAENGAVTQGCSSPRGLEVTVLEPTDTKRWLTSTRTSQHVLDLDARRTNAGRDQVGKRCLHQPLALTRIQVWPRVGSQMLVWVADPDVPDLLEHYRVRATIARMAHRRRLPGEAR